MARLIFNDGRELELDPQAPTTVGTSSDATVRLADARASEMHCVIRSLKAGGFGLKDLGSQAGTFVNGRTVRAVRLRDGDRLTVGAVTLQFAAGDSPAGQPTPPTEATQPIAGDPRDDLPLGMTIGGYEIQSIVGHGGMGTVHRAVQLSLHREVALKVLKRELCQDPVFVKRFISEARAAGKFNHPHVVHVFDVAEHEGRPFYSMELLPGGSLEDQLRERGQLPVEEAVSAIRDAARGLAYADELHIVHRDIKPDNLMPTAQGVVKICDLGLATDPKKAKQGKILGTPHFISPEQARGLPVDHRSDLYSLGCTFFRLLTGKNPYQRRTVREILKAHVEEPPPRTRDAAPDVPEDIEAIIQRLMAKDPGDRYQHAAELVADLDAWFEKKKHGRRVHVAILGGLVVALAGTLGFFLLRDPGEKIRTVVQQDPHAAKIQQQNKEILADNALLKISRSLPPLQRAAALEAMAKAHAGTRAARKALGEAEALRAAEADRLAKARARRAREAARAKRVEQEGLVRLRDAGPSAAWAHVLQVAGDGNRPEVVDAAVAKMSAAVLTAIRERGKQAFAALESALAAEDADLEAAGKSFRSAVALADGPVPDGARALVDDVLARGNQALQRAAAERARQRTARLVALLGQRRALLVARDGVLSKVRAGRLDDALAALGSIPESTEFPRLWQPIERLGRLLRAAKAGHGQLAAAIRDGSRPKIVYLGEEFRVSALRARELTLVHERGHERTVELWDSPPIVLDLFATPRTASESEDARTSRCAVLLACALANGLPQALAFLGELSDGNPAAEPEFPWLLLEPIAQAPADLRAETHAVLQLGKLLRAWQRGADEAAGYHADVLEREHAESIVGIALGIESSRRGETPGNGSGKREGR